MRKRYLCLLALICATVAKAQPSISIVGGLQQSAISPAMDIYPDAASSAETQRFSPRFGFMASLPVSARSPFYFQPGVLYSAKGSKVTHLMDPAKSDIRSAVTTLNFTYIDIPLHLVYKIPLKGNTRFIIGGGPQTSLFYNGNTKTSALDSNGVYTINENKDLPVGNKEAQYKTVHFALNALTGFEIGKMSITAYYSQDLTGFYQQNSISYKYTTAGVSMAIALGKETKKQIKDREQDKEGIPDQLNPFPDKDGDGIADKEDQCPGVAGTAANNGCPIVDTDGDGVNDKIDACPAIAGPAKYGGCPVPDTDKDGINDEEDQCPAVVGVKENGGCPVAKVDEVITEKVNLAARYIQFELKMATLTASSFEKLDEVTAILANNPDLKITIEGHSSTEGAAAYNLKLSQQRADRVQLYFISKGIAPERITSIGYGSSKPLIKETTEADRAANRRVTLILSH